LREFLDRWKGVALAAVGVVATLWLAATGRLGLYIHPRYFVFTVIMAVVAVVFLVAAFAVPRARGHDHARPASSARRRLGTAAGALIVVAAAVALLVLPPATLTSATASQRELNAAAAVGDSVPQLVGGDPSTFTVKDWALLLRQNPDPADFADPIEVTGFVLPSGDHEDVFYVARFTVTCCAVDAQPVGVPVHLPGWQDRFEADQWVAASGRLADDPAGGASVVLVPESVEETDQPEQPYVF
jgi:uncharacterized repeat protein (TIGR03943 family)